MTAADGETTASLVGPDDEPRAVAYAILVGAADRAFATDPAACILDEIEGIDVAAQRAHHPPQPSHSDQRSPQQAEMGPSPATSEG